MGQVSLETYCKWTKEKWEDFFPGEEFFPLFKNIFFFFKELLLVFKKKKSNKTPKMVIVKRWGRCFWWSLKRGSTAAVARASLALLLIEVTELLKWWNPSSSLLENFFMKTCIKIWIFFLNGWGGGGLFYGVGRKEGIATLDRSIVCGVNSSSKGPEFSGLLSAHSWIMYILLQKEESKLCIFYILYIGRYLSNWLQRKIYMKFL